MAQSNSFEYVFSTIFLNLFTGILVPSSMDIQTVLLYHLELDVE